MTPPRTQESREEQAKREVGHTDFAPGARWFLFALFFVVVCGVPLVDQTLDWRDRRSPDAPFPRPQVLDLLDAVPARSEAVESLKREGVFRAGYLMNAKLLKGMSVYEDALEDGSRIAQWLLPPVQSLLIGRLGAGNEQAYCGRDGWLFYRPEIDYLTGPGFLDPKVLAARARRGDEWNPPPQPDPVKAILEFNDALAARGIALVLLPAPGKAMVYPEQFSSRYDGGRALENPSFRAFKEAVEARGVYVCETAPALLELKKRGTQSFLARDTHWSLQGAEEAARVLAALLREKNLLPEREPVAYTRTETTVTNLGDIANMLSLPEDQPFYPEERVTLRQVHTPDGAPWAPSHDADILFLGDSYANIYSLAGMGWGEGAGVIAQLSAELARPADAILMNDNGAYATRRALSRELAQGKDRLAGKTVVVYEFAARELAVGDWKTGLTLELGTRRISAPADAESSAASAAVPRLCIRATLKAASTVPEPDDILPYTENLTVFEYSVDSVVAGACDLPAVYVAHWGVRDGKAVAETRQMKPGDARELTLERFEDHPELEGVNISDNAVTDFSVPVLYAVAEPVPQGGCAPMTLLAGAREGTPLEAEPGFGPFAEDELAARAAAIQDDLDRIRQLIAAQRGWDAWETRQAQARAAVEPLLLRENEPRYYFGKNGFLYDRGIDLPYCVADTLGLSPPPRALFDQGARAPADVICDLNERLRRRNIHLIVVPIPARAEVDPEFVVPEGDGLASDWVHPGRIRFLQALLEKDVEAVDVLPALRERKAAGAQTSLKTESHYTPEAARAVAAEIARRLRRYAFTRDPAYRLDVTLTETSLTYTGVYAKRYAENLEEPLVERLPMRTVLSKGKTPLAAPETAPILVIGDSYVEAFSKYGADIVSQLSGELALPASRILSAGGGPRAPRALAQLDPAVISSKRVIVWLFSARYLAPSEELRDEWRALQPEWLNASPFEDEPSRSEAADRRPVGSVYGAFLGDELTARARDIESERERIEQWAHDRGGWDAWTASLTPYREAFRAQCMQEVAGNLFMDNDGFIFSRGWDVKYLLADHLGLQEPSALLGARGVRSPSAVIVDLDRQLKQRNIHLLVVPVPPRSEMEPNRVVPPGSLPGNEWAHIGRLQFVDALLREDVEAIDLYPALRALQEQGIPISMRKDSHFTPEAVRAAAACVAERIRRYAFTRDPALRTTFTVEQVEAAYKGNLAEYWTKETGQAMDAQETFLFHRVRGPDGKLVKNVSESPVLIVGDSYGYVFQQHSADFRSQLSAQLELPVAMLNEGAGGPRGPRMIASQKPELFSRRRVIVWIFAARYLDPPPSFEDAWKPAVLPGGTP